MNQKSEQGEDSHLAQALRRLLRPLVRFLLSRGFTYIRLIQILRPLYVELADESQGKGLKPLTDSRISVLTGIARRYVKELRESPPTKDPAVLKASPNTRLVAQWVTNPRYTEKSGIPLVLPRFATDNGSPSFDELAELASNDVRPRTLLDDLEDKGMVRIHSNHQVELLSHAYRPDRHINDMLDYFGMHIHDHLAAATHNLNRDDSPFFERSAFQDGLTPESIEELKKYSDEQGMELLKAVYARAAELADQDRDNPHNTQRFRIGTYVYAEPDEETDNPEE